MHGLGASMATEDEELPSMIQISITHYSTCLELTRLTQLDLQTWTRADEMKTDQQRSGQPTLQPFTSTHQPSDYYVRSNYYPKTFLLSLVQAPHTSRTGVNAESLSHLCVTESDMHHSISSISSISVSLSPLLRTKIM